MRAKTISVAAQLILSLSLVGCSSMHLPGSRESGQAAKLPELTAQQVAEQRAATERSPIYLILAGEMSGHADDATAAAKYYGTASENSSDPALLRRTTEVALYAKDYKLAARTAEKWLKVEPHSARAAASLTIANIQLGNTDAADMALDRWIGDDSRGQTQIFSELSEYLRKNSSDKIGINYANHLAARYPNSVDAQILLARMALKMDRPQSATVAARHAVALAPTNRTAHELLIIALSQAGDADGVIRALDNAQKHFPHDIRFSSGLIEANIHAGRTHIAGKLLQEALKKKISDPTVVRNLALFALQLQRPVLAEKALQKLRGIPGQQDDAELLLGRLAMQNGNIDKAIAHFRNVSATSARYVEARILLAGALFRTTGIEPALQSLDQAVAPGTGSELDVADLQRMTLAKAGLLQSDGQFKRALNALNHGLTRWPDANDIRLQRALVLFRLNRGADAKQTLRTIIKSDPENAAALNALGFTLVEENQSLDEAYSLIKRALKLDPENSAYMDSLGWYYYRKGDLDKAENELSRAFKRTPDAEIGAHLGEVLWQQGEHEKARGIWKRSLGLDPTSNPLKKALKRYAPDMLKKQQP